MEVLNQLTPFVESVGFPALIFAIWYLYHQSHIKTFTKIIENNFAIYQSFIESKQR